MNIPYILSKKNIGTNYVDSSQTMKLYSLGTFPSNCFSIITCCLSSPCNTLHQGSATCANRLKALQLLIRLNSFATLRYVNSNFNRNRLHWKMNLNKKIELVYTSPKIFDFSVTNISWKRLDTFSFSSQMIK